MTYESYFRDFVPRFRRFSSCPRSGVACAAGHRRPRLPFAGRGTFVAIVRGRCRPATMAEAFGLNQATPRNFRTRERYDRDITGISQGLYRARTPVKPG